MSQAPEPSGSGGLTSIEKPDLANYLKILERKVCKDIMSPEVPYMDIISKLRSATTTVDSEILNFFRLLISAPTPEDNQTLTTTDMATVQPYKTAYVHFYNNSSTTFHAISKLFYGSEKLGHLLQISTYAFMKAHDSYPKLCIEHKILEEEGLELVLRGHVVHPIIMEFISLLLHRVIYLHVGTKVRCYTVFKFVHENLRELATLQNPAHLYSLPNNTVFPVYSAGRERLNIYNGQKESGYKWLINYFSKQKSNRTAAETECPGVSTKQGANELDCDSNIALAKQPFLESSMPNIFSTAPENKIGKTSSVAKRDGPRYKPYKLPPRAMSALESPNGAYEKQIDEMPVQEVASQNDQGIDMDLEPRAAVFPKTSAEEKTFVWKIPKFIEVVESDVLVRSQVYILEMGQGLGIRMVWKFQLSIMKVDNKKWVGIDFRPVELPKHTSKLSAQVKVKIEQNGTPGKNYFAGKQDVDLQPEHIWTFDKMISLNAMLPLTKDGSLEILGTVIVTNIGRKIHKQGSVTKTFLWSIPIFETVQDYAHKVNGQICTFEVGGDIGIPTKWECYLVDHTQGENKCIGVYAKLTEYPKGLGIVLARLQFQTSRSAFLVPTRDMSQGGPHGIREFIVNKVYPTTPNGALEITVIVTLHNVDPRDSQLALTLVEYEDIFTKNLRANLADIPKKPLDLPDKAVRVVSKDNKAYQMDPNIMAARCPSLKKKLKAIMAPQGTRELKMNNMAAESLEVFLEFCNTGKLKETWKQAPVLEDLVSCAHKYKLDDLKEFLDLTLHLICTPTNIGKLLSLAEKFGMKNAENGMLEYHKTNYNSGLKSIKLTERRQ